MQNKTSKAIKHCKSDETLGKTWHKFTFLSII